MYVCYRVSSKYLRLSRLQMGRINTFLEDLGLLGHSLLLSENTVTDSHFFKFLGEHEVIGGSQEDAGSFLGH